MDVQCKQHDVATLVKEHITSWDEPAGYIETLDQMFFDWVTYPDMCYTTEYRTTVVNHYRNLKALLTGLQKLEAITPQGNNAQ